ncbi:MAG: hypothetical protein CMG42_01300 [Candidatus Marinimicrobia bacterium]|nr:hypothetical protein [Candidatus Neomarinimicrobiota bacterium]
MDVNAIVYCGTDNDEITLVQQNAALNVKRPVVYTDQDWMDNTVQDPYRILNTLETKIIWHPVGV